MWHIMGYLNLQVVLLMKLIYKDFKFVNSIVKVNTFTHYHINTFKQSSRCTAEIEEAEDDFEQ